MKQENSSRHTYSASAFVYIVYLIITIYVVANTHWLMVAKIQNNYEYERLGTNRECTVLKANHVPRNSRYDLPLASRKQKKIEVADFCD